MEVQFLFESGQFNDSVVIQSQLDASQAQLTRPDFVPIIDSANTKYLITDWGALFVIDVAKYRSYGNFSSITSTATGWLAFSDNKNKVYTVERLTSYRVGTTQVVSVTFKGFDVTPTRG